MKKRYLIPIFALFIQLTSAQIFDVDTIQYTGSIDNRINLVILGDGYTIAEMSKFNDDARGFSEALFSESPYSENENYFNVFAIETPSKESGASHPRIGPDDHDYLGYHPYIIVDNYFGSTFDFDEIHRLLVATKTSEIGNVLANNFPSYDIAMIIVNTDFWGGAGGTFATATANSPEIIIHEIGHSFSNLADEYYAGDQFFVESINMTKENDPEKVKWKNWINENGINIFSYEGSSTALNWYHPHENCKMGNVRMSFCSVCIEGIIEKIHSLISPIDSFSPENKEKISFISPMEFSLNLNKPTPNTLGLKWSLNGIVINHNDDSIWLNQNKLVHGINELQVLVEDATTLLRIDNHETIHIYSVLWTIDSTTLAIIDISEDHLNIEIFPNPTEDILNIKLNKKIEEKLIIKVFSITGQELITKTIYKYIDTISLNIKNLSSGIYIIKFQFGNGLVITRKIIKS